MIVLLRLFVAGAPENSIDIVEIVNFKRKHMQI